MGIVEIGVVVCNPSPRVRNVACEDLLGKELACEGGDVGVYGDAVVKEGVLEVKEWWGRDGCG